MGPMREETNSWFSRIYLGKDTPHATAEERASKSGLNYGNGFIIKDWKRT